MNTESQNKKIKEYLLSGKSLTPIDALKMFGCFRLGARIYDLKKSGMLIESKMIEKDKKKFAQYTCIVQ